MAPASHVLSLPLAKSSATKKTHLVRREMAPSHVEEPPVLEPVQGTVTPEAAEAFIEGKRIGDRIKYLRQRKGMGLVELGRHTGLSASFLSQLETGRVVPTLRNLARVAMVFSKDMSFFFEPERPEMFRIVRSSERTRQPQTGAEGNPSYFFEGLGQIPMESPIAPYITEFQPLGGTRPGRGHQHVGAEFLYMLSGRLEITHQGKSETIEDGDAVYFHADATHSYTCLGSEPATALILTMPELARGVPSGSRVPVLRSPKAPQKASVV